MELYKKHRPGMLKEVVGQSEAVRTLSGYIKRNEVPHAILFTGPSGCGKTTLARILRVKLNCSDPDFNELNCADFRGIEMVRDIRSSMSLGALGECRVWLIDECHRLTPDAQDAFLKILEDTPRHVYFMLATTEPGKLKQTIKTRCTEIKLSLLSEDHARTLVTRTAEAEGVTLDVQVVDKLVDCAGGSARKLLVLLDSVVGLKTMDEQLKAISAGAHEVEAIALARILIKPNASWSEIAKIVKGLDDDVESLRRLVLGYCQTILLSGGAVAPRAYDIINIFRDNFYDSGKAGLVAACYEAFNLGGKRK